VPDGDEKMRAVCSSCGRVHYENPKMVWTGLENRIGICVIFRVKINMRICIFGFRTEILQFA